MTSRTKAAEQTLGWGMDLGPEKTSLTFAANQDKGTEPGICSHFR